LNASPGQSAGLARRIIIAAGAFGAFGVILGAFGTHYLPPYLTGMGVDGVTLDRRLAQFDTGARYHLVHAVSLLALANLAGITERARRAVFVLFVAGIVFFSGSLYLLVLTDTPWLGAITPIGGVAWISAWTTIAVSAFNHRPSPAK